LQTDDKRRETRRHSLVDGCEHACKIAGVQQDTGYADVQDLPSGGRPWRPENQRNRKKEGDNEQESKN
jgi:hypothetical protein